MNRVQEMLAAAAGVDGNGQAIEAEQKPIKWRKLSDLATPEEDAGNELLKNRFLCRGGGALFVGPTGIGKSAFEIQAACLWAIGKPLFGITPARPLRSVIIQAENDEGDLREMRDGVFNGLGLSDAERELATDSIIVADETCRTSVAFFVEVVEPLLELHKPDLLWIDPAFGYLGGQANQEAVTPFLRNGLNPLLQKYRCGGWVVHHTNKPPSGKEKPDWQAGDFAYLGSGSIEWANWARGVLAIRSIGSDHVYELRAGKRGRRLGWKDENGNPAYFRLVAHSKEPGVICWCDAEAADTPAAKSAKNVPPKTKYDLLALIPATGSIDKNALASKARAEGIADKRGRGLLAELLESGQAYEWQVHRPGVRPAIRISREPQKEAPNA
jgi:hypothetical protein